MNGFYIFLILIFEIHRVECAKIQAIESCETYPCLIFNEEFERFDFSTWKHMQTCAATGNKEFQYYINNRTNSFVKDGVLHLKPTLTNDTYNNWFLTAGTLDLWGGGTRTCTSNAYNGCKRTGTEEMIINPIQSAAITTQESFSFKYGKIEVRAKVPQGDWLWPAVWLVPKHYEYGKWPSSGEIDLLESRGNNNLKNEKDEMVGNQRVQQSLHWGPHWSKNGHYLTRSRTNKDKGSFADDYNTFSFVWDEDSIIFYVNDKQTLNVTMDEKGFWDFGKFNQLNGMSNPWQYGTKMAPFDAEFYIILNLAVGGTVGWFTSLFKPSPPWNNTDGLKAMTSFWEARDQWLPTWDGNDSAFKIDYVKVWKTKKFDEKSEALLVKPSIFLLLTSFICILLKNFEN